MKRAPSPQGAEKTRARSLVIAAREEEEVERRPLEWGLMRRLFGYTRPVADKRNWLIVLTVTRSLQLPALAWLVGEIIAGPIAGGDLSATFWGVGGYLALAVATEVLFHFRQRFAQELGETVVNALRS